MKSARAAFEESLRNVLQDTIPSLSPEELTKAVSLATGVAEKWMQSPRSERSKVLDAVGSEAIEEMKGWTGAATTTATATLGTQGRQRTPQRGTEDTEVRIPVVEEDISVSKREVEHGHVRIYSRVTEQPVEESVRLREEKVTVERRPADRPATEADFAAAGKDVIEMTETVEEPVVSKQARVVEEVVVQKEVAEHTETVRGTARHTEVEVQRAPEDATMARRTTAPQGFAAYDATFREHYTTAFTNSGAAYAVYEPAYRYGYELGTNERYRGRDWAALEADARRDWEARHPSTWERFKDAVRYGWNRVCTRT